jgi:hypothetical protein
MLKLTSYSVYVFRAGIRDVGRKHGEFRQRIDMTSPIPWWRQIHDSDLLYDPSPEVFTSPDENADPANHRLPIFDDGYFYEDHVNILSKYLENYEANNSDTFRKVESLRANIKYGFHTLSDKLEESEKLRKGFVRSYKRKKLKLQHNYTDKIYTKSEKRMFNKKFERSCSNDEALTDYLEHFASSPQYKEKKNFHETIGKELPHVRHDPRLARFIPTEWNAEALIPPDQSEFSRSDLITFELESDQLKPFDVRSKEEKQNQITRELRRWRLWQELKNAYNEHDGNISRDIRCHSRTNSILKLSLNDREIYNDQELLDVVMCSESSTPGCHPIEILPLLIVKPPPPHFRSTTLSRDIGYRWIIETEEWLKKHNLLLNKQELVNLTRSAVTFTDRDRPHLKFVNKTTIYSDQLEKEELPEFMSDEKVESTPAKPGFAANEVLIHKFSGKEIEDLEAEHYNHHKLIICGEYPSYCYGNLADSEATSYS